MDGPGSHQRAREAVAVGKLRQVRELQEAFAASNPRKGYACQLQLLKPAPVPNQDYDPYEFLIQDSHAGYRISVLNCAPDADGVVRTYQAVAVPVNPGVSGNRAFCLDEQGVIWLTQRVGQQPVFLHESRSVRSAATLLRDTGLALAPIPASLPSAIAIRVRARTPSDMQQSLRSTRLRPLLLRFYP